MEYSNYYDINLRLLECQCVIMHRVGSKRLDKVLEVMGASSCWLNIRAQRSVLIFLRLLCLLPAGFPVNKKTDALLGGSSNADTWVSCFACKAFQFRDASPSCPTRLIEQQ